MYRKAVVFELFNSVLTEHFY